MLATITLGYYGEKCFGSHQRNVLKCMSMNDGFCDACVEGDARLFAFACGERGNDCLLIHRALEVLEKKVIQSCRDREIYIVHIYT